MTVKIARQNMFFINVSEEEEKCTEAQLDILLKINTGEYRLVKKKKRSSVWNVYREIARADGSKLKWRYFCLGCKRVMQSTGGTTSNLRIHKCHVRYLKQNGHLSGESRSSHNTFPAPSARTPRNQELARRAPILESQLDEIYEIQMDPLEEETEECLQEENDMTVKLPTARSNPRPLLKLLTEELELEPEADANEQQPIELDPSEIQHPAVDCKEVNTQPSSIISSSQLDASAVSEAESYAKAWAHAFLRLSEDQKLYAKRSIDELLVLGRLERLSISTVTSLSANL
ncbi:hypothetical protein KR009_005965 [Drosophila setifemur]|nr:hypothetical protein KR009_005965 [Drosophila setifemur]